MDKIITKQNELLDKIRNKFDNFPKSNTVNKLEQSKDKMNHLLDDYPSIGNQTAQEFVDFLNSDVCNHLSIIEKERYKNEFIFELKKILISLSKKYLTK